MSASGWRCWTAISRAPSTNEVRRCVARTGPRWAAHDAAAEGVQDDRQEHEPAPRGDVGDVRHPEPVGCLGGELAFDQVRDPVPASPTPSRLEPLAAGRSLDATLPHQFPCLGGTTHAPLPSTTRVHESVH